MNPLIVNFVSVTLKLATFISKSLSVSAAFRLFCYPSIRCKLKDTETNFMANASLDKININGSTVNVYGWGDGKRPILLIHGWESRGSRFALLMDRLLTDGFSPITFDLPGHGDSGGKKTTIVECDQICAELHRTYGKFEAVIAHSFGVPCAFYTLKNSISSDRVIAISGLAEFQYLVDEFCRILRIHVELKAGLVDRIEKLFVPLDNIWNRFSVAYESHNITSSVLVIHDKHDEIVKIEQGRKIASIFGQQARFLETNGLGHSRVLKSEIVIDSISEFLN